MSEALQRHEQDLLRMKQLRKIQENDFKEQIKMQEEIVKAEQEQQDFKKLQLHQELTQQMQEAQQRKQAAHQEKKDKVMTSGGPTMEAEDTEGLRKKFKNQQKLTKIELEK